MMLKKKTIYFTTACREFLNTSICKIYNIKNDGNNKANHALFLRLLKYYPRGINYFKIPKQINLRLKEKEWNNLFKAENVLFNDKDGDALKLTINKGLIQREEFFSASSYLFESYSRVIFKRCNQDIYGALNTFFAVIYNPYKFQVYCDKMRNNSFETTYFWTKSIETMNELMINQCDNSFESECS